MKKTFEQPELMVVRMNNSDIVTLSLQSNAFNSETGTILSAGRRFDEWYEGY